MKKVFFAGCVLLLFCHVGLAASFSDNKISQMINQSWQHYRQMMIGPAGRPLCDRDESDVDDDGDREEFLTCSEGVGYVMLRAVYINDQETFDRVWQWAGRHLWRRNLSEVYFWGRDQNQANGWQSLPSEKRDNLFAWRFCESINQTGRSGVIYYLWSGNGCLWRDGLDSATDADQDIAAALIFAHKLWGSNQNDELKNYLKCSQLILKDIWEKEVKDINGRYYVLAGDKYSQINGINPSYFRMSYYSGIFQEADPTHPWPVLVESSYRILLKCREAILPDENGSAVASKVNLPPNWIALDSGGNIVANPWNRNGYLFGWDAFRVLYQVALHYKTSADPYAASYLKDCFSSSFDFGPNYFLKQELENRGKICGGYKIDGSRTFKEGLNRELSGQNGAYLAYFYAGGDLETAGQILESLDHSYRADGYWGFNPQEYYQQNWAWFGLELTTGRSLALFGVKAEPQVAMR